jgi:hypothetical protein
MNAKDIASAIAERQFCKIQVLMARAHKQVPGKPHLLMVRGHWTAFYEKKARKRNDAASKWCRHMNYGDPL